MLKALRDKSIKVDFITGSSIGAVIGAMYAATLDPDWVESRFREFLKSDRSEERRVGKECRSRWSPYH